MIGCVAAAAACNKNHTRELRKEINVRGGAVMPHALINCRTDVRAEADLWLPTCSASALSTRTRSEQ